MAVRVGLAEVSADGDRGAVVDGLTEVDADAPGEVGSAAPREAVGESPGAAPLPRRSGIRGSRRLRGRGRAPAVTVAPPRGRGPPGGPGVEQPHDHRGEDGRAHHAAGHRHPRRGSRSRRRRREPPRRPSSPRTTAPSSPAVRVLGAPVPGVPVPGVPVPGAPGPSYAFCQPCAAAGSAYASYTGGASPSPLGRYTLGSASVSPFCQDIGAESCQDMGADSMDRKGLRHNPGRKRPKTSRLTWWKTRPAERYAAVSSPSCR